jgi:hypothetical protein
VQLAICKGSRMNSRACFEFVFGRACDMCGCACLRTTYPGICRSERWQLRACERDRGQVVQQKDKVVQRTQILEC